MSVHVLSCLQRHCQRRHRRGSKALMLAAVRTLPMPPTQRFIRQPTTTCHPRWPGAQLVVAEEDVAVALLQEADALSVVQQGRVPQQKRRSER